MITKESLLQAKASVNEATFKIMQSYSNSPSSKTIFFVVEGKDDITYYGTKAGPYVPEGWRLLLIPAGNRRKAIQSYRSLDWKIFSKKLIMFFIDRDLSDYTGEDTPTDTNIYVTSSYAIENELCTIDTFVRALKYHCDLNDIDEVDENTITTFYTLCWQQFSYIAKPLMSQILYWKLNHIDANYANFKVQHVFDVTFSGLVLKSQYRTVLDILPDFYLQSNIPYNNIDLSPYATLLDSKSSPNIYIRGKFILTFFSKTLNFVIQNSASILPSKTKAKDTLGLGYENVISRLSGIMRVPDSLHCYFTQMKTNLNEVNS